MRILIRVNYGYYVVERLLIRCFNENVKAALRNEVSKNMGFLGGNALKNKWSEVIRLSQAGILNPTHISGNSEKVNQYQ
jgi:hypothetical protein